MPSHGDYETTSEEHIKVADEVLGGVTVIFLCYCLAHIFERLKPKCSLLHYVNETNVAIGVGTIVGIILRTIPDDIEVPFEPEILYYILLPPIIFDAGYSLKKQHFFQNFGSILVFAIFGTFVSAFLIAAILFFLAKAGVIHHLDTEKGFFEALLFGAMISAVDPVSTISIIQSHSGFARDHTLPSIMFGESVLNDAVSIVLFRSLSLYKDENFFTPAHLFGALGIFVLVFTVSMLIGIFFALLISFGFRKADIAHHSLPMVEVVLMVLFLFLSYMLAEAASMSGIVSLFFFGVAVSHYNWSNLSVSAQITTAHGFKALAAIAETSLYAYLGLTLSSGIDKWDASLVACTMGAILIARACAIFPLSLVINSFRHNPFPPKYQAVLWYAGLRGAIAFGLALDFPTDNRPFIVSTTIFVVLFTTVVFGSATSPFLKIMDIDSEAARQEDLVEQALAREVKARQSHRIGRMWQRVLDFEIDYMRPFFGVGAAHSRSSSISLSPRHELDAHISEKAFMSMQMAMNDSVAGDGTADYTPVAAAESSKDNAGMGAPPAPLASSHATDDHMDITQTF